MWTRQAVPGTMRGKAAAATEQMRAALPVASTVMLGRSWGTPCRWRDQRRSGKHRGCGWCSRCGWFRRRYHTGGVGGAAGSIAGTNGAGGGVRQAAASRAAAARAPGTATAVATPVAVAAPAATAASRAVVVTREVEGRGGLVVRRTFVRRQTAPTEAYSSATIPVSTTAITMASLTAPTSVPPIPRRRSPGACGCGVVDSRQRRRRRP